MRKTLFLVLLFGIILGFFLRDLLRDKPAQAKLITINSRNLEFQIITQADTIGEVLGENSISAELLQNSTRTLPQKTADKIINGMRIYLAKPLEIIWRDAGKEQVAVTNAATVGDFLSEQNVALAYTDKVTPTLETFLAKGQVVNIDRIVDLEIKEISEIPFSTNLEYDASEFYGHNKVFKAGKQGKREQVFLITYKNGVEIRRRLLSEKILENPQTEVRSFGTKVEIEETQEGRASWYVFRRCLCAAHPFYDFGRYARVTSLGSGKSIIVQINDRGPDLAVHPDRVIDLDSVAFRELAPLGAGTTGVKVELFR